MDKRFPKEIEERINDSFLETFKNEIDIILGNEKAKLKVTPTYWNFYQNFELSTGTQKALLTSCELHDFVELYNYLICLDYNDGKDELYGRLTEMMCERGIIEEGEITTYSDQCQRNYELLEEELELSGMTFEEALDMIRLISKEDNSSAFGNLENGVSDFQRGVFIVKTDKEQEVKEKIASEEFLQKCKVVSEIYPLKTQ